MITDINLSADEKLLRQFVSPNLYVYFRLKAPHLSPDELKTQLTELLKFLLLSNKFPGNILFGQDLDDLWHLWVMQSKQYDAFCSASPFGKFIHHDSNDFPKMQVSWADAEKLAQAMKLEKEQARNTRPMAALGSAEFEEALGRMLSFFASYVSSFGPLKAENVRYWPTVGRMLQRLKWSVDEFNAFLMAQGKPVEARAGEAVHA